MLPKTSYHEHGLNKAKEVVEFFKKASDKYAESIKMEAELSIDKLNSLQKNSSEEMNEYVKNPSESIGELFLMAYGGLDPEPALTMIRD